MTMQKRLLSVVGLVCIATGFGQDENRPPGITERLFSDPVLMVEDAVESMDGSPIVWRYIVENPENYRVVLFSYARNQREPRRLVRAAQLCVAVLEPAEALEIIEKALESLPEQGSELTLEARETLVKLKERVAISREAGERAEGASSGTSNPSPPQIHANASGEGQNNSAEDYPRMDWEQSGWRNWIRIFGIAGVGAAFFVLVRVWFRCRGSRS